MKELKDNIYVWVEELGEGEFESVHQLVKAYFKLWTKHRINNFGNIQYRGYQLVIRDKDGYCDAETITKHLENQIERINKNENNKEVK